MISHGTHHPSSTAREMGDTDLMPFLDPSVVSHQNMVQYNDLVFSSGSLSFHIISPEFMCVFEKFNTSILHSWASSISSPPPVPPLNQPAMLHELSHAKTPSPTYLRSKQHVSSTISFCQLRLVTAYFMSPWGVGYIVF